MTTTSQSYKIASGLFLVLASVTAGPPVPATPEGVNHFVAIDRSGSMYGVMPRMRESMKAKILGLMKDNDTLTLLVFSSRREYKVVLEGETVASLKDLRSVHAKIDAELRATNLTGFVDPLNAIGSLVGKVKAKNPGPADLWFMSDGYDNQWSRAEILKAMADASKEMAAVTVVEFGDYADRALLAEMATVAGGKHIYAESFGTYEPLLEKAMSSRSTGASKVEEKVDGDPIGGLAFALHKGDLLSFSLVNGHVAVPGDLKTFAYLSPTPVGASGLDLNTYAEANAGSKMGSDSFSISLAYAALSLFSVRMRSDLVFPILKALGDVRLVRDFSVCFGKQRYSAFMDTTRDAANGTGRFLQGYDPNAVPPDDCFTIWNLLSILTAEPGAKLLIDQFGGSYKKVGRATVNASEKLTKDESAKIAVLQAAIDKITTDTKGAKGTKLLKSATEEKAKLQAEIDAILTSKKDPPEFVSYEMPDGIPVTGLVYNEEQPNISIQTRRSGTVEIREVVDAAISDPTNAAIVAGLKGLPQVIETFQFRNYAIVKDGLVNVDELPVTIPGSMWGKLLAAGMPSECARINSSSPADAIVPDSMNVTFFLRQIPVINRSMVKAASGQKLFELELRLAKCRADQKVFKAYKKAAVGGKTSATFEASYGKETTTWLKDALGLTDFSGYNPKKVQADPVDFYMGKFLNVTLYEEGALKQIADGKTASGKLDTLPSVKEVQETIAKKGKLAGGKALMAETIKSIDAKKADIEKITLDPGHDPMGTATADYREKVFNAWLVEREEAIIWETRKLLLEKARYVFVILVGQVWFTEPEFAVPVEITLKGKTEDKKLLGSTKTFDVGGQKFDFLAGQEERKVLI